MNQSEKVDELAKALCEFQKELKPALKDSTNPFFKSKYADLESVWEAAREMTKHGLSVCQTASEKDNKTLLVTTLLHSSGQWIRGEYPVKAQKEDPQAQGSAMTYARRYCLSAILGIVQSDDDGESAMERKQPSNPVVKKEVKPIQPKQATQNNPVDPNTPLNQNEIASLWSMYKAFYSNNQAKAMAEMEQATGKKNSTLYTFGDIQKLQDHLDKARMAK